MRLTNLRTVVLTRLEDKTTLVGLRIAGSVTTAAGGTAALFGEPWLGTGLSWVGYVSLASIAAGVCVSAAGEILERRLDRSSDRRDALRDRALREWVAVGQQSITSIAIDFKHRWEMTISDFMNYIGEVAIEIMPDVTLESLPGTITLRFDSVSASDNLEDAYALAAIGPREFRAVSTGVSFSRRSTDGELAPRGALPPAAYHDPGPNDATESQPRLTSVVDTIEAVTMVIGDWGYTSSNKDVWMDPSQLTCGVYATMSWRALSPKRLLRVSEIALLQRLSVTLPRHFNLRPCDEFKLTLFTSGSEVLSVDFRNRRYAQREGSGTWAAGLNGTALYRELADDFVESRIARYQDTDR